MVTMGVGTELRAGAIGYGEGAHRSEVGPERGAVLSKGRIACVGVILHELMKVRISVAESIDAAVDSGESSVDDVVSHEPSILSSPISR